MLRRLLPDQVAKYWQELKPAIEFTLPPMVDDSIDRMNNILSAMLVGGMDCWLSYRKLEKGIELNGLVVTTIQVENCSNTRSLLLYSVFSPEGTELGIDGWTEGYQALCKYAKSVQCIQLVGYTDVPHIVEMAEKVGGEGKFTYVTVPL